MARDEKSSYYDAGGIEVFDVLKAKLTPKQFKGFLLGNALKYGLRMNHKGQFGRDAEKAANYATWLNDFEKAQRKLLEEEHAEKIECITRPEIDAESG